MTPAEIDALEARIYPHRRDFYAKDFARLRAGITIRPPRGGGRPALPIVHGTAHAYKQRECRCQLCRTAIAKTTREARLKRRAAEERGHGRKRGAA